MSSVLAPTPFGDLLRRLRGNRGLSQSSLAVAAEISARHLSFLENGRSRPSREMVLVLGNALDLSLRDRNLLLRTAGFAAVYREEGLDAPSMAAVRRSLAFVLERMAPNGVVILDRQWNAIDMNTPMRTVLTWLLGGVPARLNVMSACFDPRLVRPFIQNLDQLGPVMLDRLHREAMTDERSRALLDEVLTFPALPRHIAVMPTTPVIPFELVKDGVRLSLFSTIAVLSTAADATADDLRIETYFPADDATERFVAALMGA
jgi:transcriptional regulator with XRE-family HTH domain